MEAMPPDDRTEVIEHLRQYALKRMAQYLQAGGRMVLFAEGRLSRTGSLIFRDTSAGVVFCPEHAQMLATAGFSKQDVQAWLIEHCGRTGADLRRAGKNGLRGIARFADADTSADDAFTRILPSPRHVPIVVAGARNAAISMVVRVFGEWSGTAVEVTK